MHEGDFEGPNGSEGPHSPRPPRPRARYALTQAGKLVLATTPVKEKKRRKRCSQVPPARLAELTESLKAFARKVQGFGNRCERGLLTDAWLIERQLASPVMLYKVVADINIKS